MKAAVINCSFPHYNLGALKLANWLRVQGYEVQEQGMGEVDLVCLSVIFSWDAPKAVQIAQHYRDRSEVWAGGPGLFGDKKNNYAMRSWWKEQTGFDCHVGLDQRFERQRGDYRMTFASRGCPVNCHFCIVPQLEGKEFTIYEDFQLAPILCDNNLSALPDEFQNHIVLKYFLNLFPLLDANSGFEPKAFTEETYHRWRPIIRGPWRFAFDMMPEISNVRNMMKILSPEPPSKKRVYVLIGNEPIESCYERVVMVLEWGGEPFCQPQLRLDALRRDDYVIRYDWTAQRLRDFARYVNTFGWRKYPLSEYQPRIGDKPFMGTNYKWSKRVSA